MTAGPWEATTTRVNERLLREWIARQCAEINRERRRLADVPRMPQPARTG